MAQHIRQGLTETHAMLLYRADDLSAAIEAFLLGPCAVNRAEAAGDFRRRVDVVDAVFSLSSGLMLRLQLAGKDDCDFTW